MNSFTLKVATLADPSLRVVGCRGSEGLSQLFRFEVTLASARAELDVHAAVGAPASLLMTTADHVRDIRGIVARIDQGGRRPDGSYEYQLVLVPRLHRLATTQRSRIFQNLSVPDIVQAVAAGIGGPLDADDITLKLTRHYPPREYVVQYQESCLAFLLRLLEDEGISHRFDWVDGRQQWILSDDNDSFPSSLVALQHREDDSETDLDGGEFAGLRVAEEVGPAQYLVQGHDATMPEVPLVAQHQIDARGHGMRCESVARIDALAAGEALAGIRAQEIRCRQRVFSATVSDTRVSPGQRLALEGHFRPSFNRELMVVALTHHFDDEGYRCEVEAIPSDVSFVPARRTPKPKLHGVMHARIDAVGPGEHATLDDRGRYRVVMPFDWDGAGEGVASLPMHMSQPYGGPGQGMHFPLSKGTDVLWSCLDGDLDRPVITGTLPTALNPSVVTNQCPNTGRITTPGGALIEFHDSSMSDGDDAWSATQLAAMDDQRASAALLSPPHLTAKDDEQDGRLNDIDDEVADGKKQDTEQDGRLDTQDLKDTQHDDKDRQHDTQLQSTTASSTWLRFAVPYDGDKHSYLRMGVGPAANNTADPEYAFHHDSSGSELLSLNTGSQNGIFNYTSGNRTVITGGNKEELVEGKHRLQINSGGLGLYDAEPLYFLDFSKEPLGPGWRKTEATHVANTTFSFGDSESFMLGMQGSYFVGLDVSGFASLQLNMGFGIKYEFVKGYDFRVAAHHDLKAREDIILRVKRRDPFFGNQKLIAASMFGAVAGVSAVVAEACADGRTGGGRAAAATAVGLTTGLAAAASVAAMLDVYKRMMRRARPVGNDASVAITGNGVELAAGDAAIQVNGAQGTIFVGRAAAGINGAGIEVDDANIVHIHAVRAILHCPTEIRGDVRINGDAIITQNLTVTGNINNAALAAAPLVLPPAPLPPVAPVARAGICAEVMRRFWGILGYP